MRFGTDSFETNGIAMMIISATLSQFKELSSIKETKKTVEDAADALNISIDEVLESLKVMQTGLRQTQEGLKGFDEARK